MTMLTAVLWIAQAVQLVAWTWFCRKGGNLPDRQYLVFSAGLMAGQLACVSESAIAGVWGPVVSQSYFFLTTGLGAYKRYQSMRAAAVSARLESAT